MVNGIICITENLSVPIIQTDPLYRKHYTTRKIRSQQINWKTVVFSLLSLLFSAEINASRLLIKNFPKFKQKKDKPEKVCYNIKSAVWSAA